MAQHTVNMQDMAYDPDPASRWVTQLYGPMKTT